MRKIRKPAPAFREDKIKNSSQPHTTSNNKNLQTSSLTNLNQQQENSNFQVSHEHTKKRDCFRCLVCNGNCPI